MQGGHHKVQQLLLILLLALRDALIACTKPFIEVHLSNVYNREDFRKKSYLSDRAEGVIVGLGKMGYLAALNYFLAK